MDISHLQTVNNMITKRFITLFLLLGLLVPAANSQTVFFSTDFNSGNPPEFTGPNSNESVQGFANHPPFSGNFLRNASSGGQANATLLSLSGLPTHTSIDLNFLLALIDSWDGQNQGGDGMVVRVDGVTVFGGFFFGNCFNGAGNTYIPPLGGEIVRLVDLGFNTVNPCFSETGYNMGLDPVFDSIPHTASTLVVEWYATGSTYQGGTDESFAIENVEVVLNGTQVAPVPTLSQWGLIILALVILCIGAIAITKARQRQLQGT